MIENIHSSKKVRVDRLTLWSSSEKTPKDIFSLKWKNLNSNFTSGISDVFAENSFTDVTLVSDDQVPFQAHKFVLSALSSVLKNILLENPQSHPLIYLRGVNHQELDSIL